MPTRVRKIAREELQHDEVAESLQDSLIWLKANRYKILLAALAFILISAVAWGYYSYRTRIRTESSQILNQAAVTFSQLSELKDEAERKKRLEDTAIALQQNVIDRYEGTPAAHNALLLQGNAYAHLEDHEKAQAAYQRFIDQSETNPDRAKGEIALGTSLENEFYLKEDQAKLTAAEQHFDRALEIAPANSYLYYFALLSKARILELTSRDAEALELYGRIVNERPAGEPETGKEERARPTTLEGMAAQQIREQEEKLNLYTTARLRLDRLEGVKQLAGPAAAPSLPLPAAADEPTTGTSAAANPGSGQSLSITNLQSAAPPAQAPPAPVQPVAPEAGASQPPPSNP